MVVGNMNMLNFVIKQRHIIMVVLCIFLCLIHFHDILKLSKIIEREQKQRSELINFFIQRNMSHTISILNTAIRALDLNQSTENHPIQYSQSIEPFTVEDRSKIAEIFDVPHDSHQLSSMLNHGTVLWGLSFNQPSNGIDLIGGRIERNPMRYKEIRLKLNHYFESFYTSNNHRVLLKNSKGEYFLPSGEKVQLNFTGSMPNQMISDIPRQLNISTITLLTLTFYQLDSEKFRYFNMIKTFVPNINASVIIFDDMTSSLIELKHALHRLVEMLMLLLVGYVLLATFSHYQRNANLELVSDPLTGLKNRSYLKSADSRLKAHSTHQSHPHISVIAIDLDHFKEINDHYGHPVGDAVLIRIGAILSENVRSNDECYRVGGDEFIVILKSETLSDTKQLAERIRVAIVDDSKLQTLIKGGVSASLGLAVMSAEQPLDETIAIADQMLYQAKKRGRNLLETSV